MLEENENDRLEILKRKYEKDIEIKEGELTALKARLATIIELGGEAQPLLMPEPQSNKYKGKRLIDSVLDSISCLMTARKGTKQGVTASQVRQYLLHHGFETGGNPRIFTIKVNVALKRLANSDRAIREDYQEKAYYRPPS